jgi:hypothetical protein
MLIPGLSKRSVHTPAVVRVAILATLLHGVASAQTGTATMCTLSNGLATGFFGGVNISGSFTIGVTPSDRSIITVNDLQVTDPYHFTGPLNGTGYLQPSQINTPCVLQGCGPTPIPGYAGLHVTPDVGGNSALLNFDDEGETFVGTATLSCSSFPYTPPANGGDVCPVNVQPFAQGPPFSSDTPPRAYIMYGNYTPAVNGVQVGLDAAAALCQVDSFNFVQQVTFGFEKDNYQGVLLTAPWSDPPPGGYCPESYATCSSGLPTDTAYPFFYSQYDLANLTPCTAQFLNKPIPDYPTETSNTLLFQDCPGNPQPGAQPTKFTTSLVGILGTCVPGATSTEGCIPNSPLYTWSWSSSYNYGSKTGGAQLKSYAPLAPGGAGGVTITSINGVQLPTAVAQIATVASGLAYSRVSKTFNGTVTITNTSSSSVSGPLQVVFFGLPATVTLVNATNNLSGTPYVTVPAPAGIAPGQSVTFAVQFSNPSNATINLSPAIYSGSMN